MNNTDLKELNTPEEFCSNCAGYLERKLTADKRADRYKAKYKHLIEQLSVAQTLLIEAGTMEQIDDLDRLRAMNYIDQMMALLDKALNTKYSEGKYTAFLKKYKGLV